MKPSTSCLNCGSIWGVGSEEYDWQKCDACGWQPGQLCDDMDDDSDFIWDDDDDRDDPNDSRNISNP